MVFKRLDELHDGMATNNLGRLLVGLCQEEPEEPEKEAVWSSMVESKNA